MISAGHRRFATGMARIILHHSADRFVNSTQVADSFFAHAYKVGVKRLPDGQSALEFTRTELELAQMGTELNEIPWGSKRLNLPPSSLSGKQHMLS